MPNNETSQPQPGWTFNPGQQPQISKQPSTPASAPQPQTGGDGISWTASEFVEHDKGTSWFMGVFFVSVVGIALIYLITSDLFSVVALGLFAVAFLIFGARKPKVLNYSLGDSGLQIGEKFYGFGQFRSFAVVDEGAINSVALLPLKRFMPAINIYFDPKDEQKIVGFLGERLPGEKRQQDPIDKFMRKIRF